MEKLTNTEEEVMNIVWKTGGGFIREFISLMKEPHPPYTTVASIVKNLEKKGYLNADMHGNTKYFTPAIKEEDYKRQSISKIVKNYFSNSYKDMVTFFANEENLSEKDLDEIISLIKNKKTK